MEKEQAQEGAVEEQAKEETSKPVLEAASTEKEATSEKVDDEWKRMMQQRTDKAEYALKSTKEELQQLRNERRQELLAARQKEIAALEGEPDEQAKARQKHQMEDELARLREETAEQKDAVGRKYDNAIELAEKYNLSLKDARSIFNESSTKKEMELMAQLKVAEQAKVQTKNPPKEEPKEGFTPDSGTSDAGADSDEAFLKAWNAGDIPATKENLARANKIINK